MTEVTGRTTRAQRMAMPLAREVVRDLAVEHGACIRPIQLRRTNLDTGAVDQVLVPCGHTLARVCPSCADRAKTLRAAQCREGWHLEDEPDTTPDPATDDQKWWITLRAEAQQHRDQAAAAGQDTADFDELIAELDAEITTAGLRGKAAPGQARAAAPLDPPPSGRPGPAPPQGQPPHRGQDLHRAGRQDLPPVPVRHADVPVVRAGRRGRSTRRPGSPMSMTGPPATPCTSPRCSTGSSRTCAATSATTCNTSPPSNPSGGSPRTSTSPCAAPSPGPSSAASWPPPTTRSGGPTPAPSNTVTAASCRSGTSTPAATSTRPPGKSSPAGTRPSTSSATSPTTWPGSGFRPGRPRRIQGRWPVHRLPDQVPDQAGRRLPPGRHRRSNGRMRPGWPRRCDTSRAHRGARTGSGTASSPRTPGPAWSPAAARARPTTPDHLGHAGRRVLASRKWSGKTLADHRADRKEWLLETLGLSATDPARYSWEPVAPDRPGPHGSRRGGCCMPSPTAPDG